MFEHRPGRIGKEDKSPAQFYCRKHPTYRAKRRPSSQCQDCHQLYQLTENLYEVLREASGKLSELTDMNIDLTAEFEPGLQIGIYHGESTSAIRMRVEKL